MPTIHRPTKSIVYQYEAAKTTEPTMNKTLEAKMTGFRPNFSLKYPPISEKTAAATNVAVTTNCKKHTETLSSPIQPQKCNLLLQSNLLI